jgi:hypothetical protein
MVDRLGSALDIEEKAQGWKFEQGIAWELQR